MKTIRRVAKIDTTNVMTVAFDVSKDTLNYYSEVEGKIAGNNFREELIIQDVIQNTHMGIWTGLQELTAYAKSQGYRGIHVVCEPTGTYSDLLLKTAHRAGHTTAYVSGESVHKSKVIENHDNSKDDIKDPRVIFMLSKMGKELVYRTLPPEYQGLRELNRMYDIENNRRKESRCRVHSHLVRLFGEFPMGKDFIFNNSGRALFELYGFNPWRIVEDSFEVFSVRMKSKVKGIFSKSLKKVYEAAQRTVLHVMSPLEVELIEQNFRFVYEDFLRSDSRRESLRQQIEEIYHKLAETEEIIPLADEKVMQPFLLGRVLGETGPLSDFKSLSQLNKYGGLNLRTRESGKFKGQLKMSKKGRAPLRGVLGGMAFKFVKRKAIFGEYYHSRKEAEKIPGTKLLANVERKILKILFGMAKRKEQYNHTKITTCESQLRVAA